MAKDYETIFQFSAIVEHDKPDLQALATAGIRSMAEEIGRRYERIDPYVELDKSALADILIEMCQATKVKKL